MRKIKIFLSTIVMLLASAGIAWAVVQSLNGQSGSTQTFSNDANVTISSATDNHALGWTGRLSVSRGGTGSGSFTSGSVLFASTASISQDNSNFFWDNTNKRLGVGTNTPSQAVDVSGTVKANQVVTNTISATGTNQSLFLNPTGTGELVVGGDSIVVASKSSNPTSPKVGQIYFHTTSGKFRGYNGSSWVNFATTPITASVEVLVVAGGGGGGKGRTAGGGGGGYQYNAAFSVIASAYTVTVGAGGTGGNDIELNESGSNGNNSVFSTITATGGGGGGGGGLAGLNGGSGGGAGRENATAGVGSQGNNGGASSSPATGTGGGGGGATSAGGNAVGAVGGNGGAGTANSITGSSVTYAGGGGAGAGTGGGGAPGSGGAGGGGAGGAVDASGANGTANLGGGGGGSGGVGSGVDGGSGGSGVVIISYPTGSLTATGGTVTTSGGNTIHTFTSSGTFTVTAI